MYNDEELLFIARNAMVPSTIATFVGGDADSPTGIPFELEGEMYLLDYYDMIELDDKLTPASPELLVRIIKQYDPEYKLTEELVGDIFTTLSEGSGMSNIEYIRLVMKVREFVSEHSVGEYIPLDNCDIEYVAKFGDFIVDFLPNKILHVMGNSITIRQLAYEISDGSVLTIGRRLLRNLIIEDTSVVGVSFQYGSIKDKGLDSYYNLRIDAAQLSYVDSDWPDADEEDFEEVSAALNIVRLLTTIMKELENALSHCAQINERGMYDVFVYDNSSADSIIALGLATYRTNNKRDFEYDFIDVNDDVTDTFFENKKVCFVGTKYSATMMEHIQASCDECVLISVDDDKRAVVDAWDYFIGKPKHCTIRLIDEEPTAYLVECLRRGVLQSDAISVLRTSGPIASDVIFSGADKPGALPPIVEEYMRLGEMSA